MALEDAVVLDLIKSIARLEYKVDCLIDDKREEEDDPNEVEDDADEDDMNWMSLLSEA